MRRIFILVFFVVSTICVLSMSSGLIPSVRAATVVVPDDYPTIQTAIDAADPGDTILVKAGTYFENLRIRKPLTLQGENAVIDGGNNEYAVWVRFDGLASNVTISGFTVQNAGTIEGLSGGVRLSYAEGCCVQNCTFIGNRNGIVLEQGENNKIAENSVLNSSSVGIYLYSSDSNLILDNTIKHNGNGVGLDNSGNNLILENEIQNSFVGVYLGLYYSQNNQVSYNNITACDAGVYVFSKASNALISDNQIFSNFDGIRTYDSHGFLNILENNFTANTNAAINFGYMDAGNNTLNSNTFQNNAADVIPEYSILILPLFLLAGALGTLKKKQKKEPK